MSYNVWEISIVLQLKKTLCIVGVLTETCNLISFTPITTLDISFKVSGPRIYKWPLNWHFATISFCFCFLAFPFRMCAWKFVQFCVISKNNVTKPLLFHCQSRQVHIATYVPALTIRTVHTPTKSTMLAATTKGGRGYLQDLILSTVVNFNSNLYR